MLVAADRAGVLVETGGARGCRMRRPFRSYVAFTDRGWQYGKEAAWQRLQQATYYRAGWSDAYGYLLAATGRVEVMLYLDYERLDCGPFPLSARGGRLFRRLAGRSTARRGWLAARLIGRWTRPRALAVDGEARRGKAADSSRRARSAPARPVEKSTKKPGRSACSTEDGRDHRGLGPATLHTLRRRAVTKTSPPETIDAIFARGKPIVSDLIWAMLLPSWLWRFRSAGGKVVHCRTSNFHWIVLPTASSSTGPGRPPSTTARGEWLLLSTDARVGPVGQRRARP